MAITPNEIRNIVFSPARDEAGYNPVEVDEFLEHISQEVDKMMKRTVELKSRNTQSENRAQAAMAENASLRQQLAAQEDKSRIEGQLSETQLSEVFVIAKQTADRMITDAEAKASEIITNAESRANETIRQSLVDKQKEIDEINRLQQSRANFLSDYQALLRNYLDESATRIPIAPANMEGMVAEDANAQGEHADNGLEMSMNA